MARAAEGVARHGTLYFAYEQWAGKGQRGRTWTSTPGENIVLSAVIEPVAFTFSQAFALSACVALACHDLFSRYAGGSDTRIKWPNDIYWNDRKAGGILIENSFRGAEWVLAVAGMGININQTDFPVSAGQPVSLRQITGQTFDVVGLAHELGQCLDRRYAALTAGAGAGPLIGDYNARLYRRGKTVRLKKENAVFETVVKEVSAQGQLLTKDVMERQFSFGEVEWVI